MSNVSHDETLRVVRELCGVGIEKTPDEVDRIRQDMLDTFRAEMDRDGLWYPEGDAELLDYIRHLLGSA